MNIPRLGRTVKTTAVMCRYCGQWRKPRQVRMPAGICRACEHAGANQTWKPSAAHLRAAHASVNRARLRKGRR